MTKAKDKKIKELESKVKELEKEVVTDPLTEISNRRGLVDRLKIIFDEVKGSSQGSGRKHVKIDDLSLLFIDVDDFKKINDKHGHDVGDEVLKSVADTLRTNAREFDVVGRLGGEEFVVGLVGTPIREAYMKAENLRDKLGQIKIKKGSKNITVSVGVASFGHNKAVNFESLLGMADKAMYEAKDSGKNKVKVLGGLPDKEEAPKEKGEEEYHFPTFGFWMLMYGLFGVAFGLFLELVGAYFMIGFLSVLIVIGFWDFYSRRKLGIIRSFEVRFTDGLVAVALYSISYAVSVPFDPIFSITFLIAVLAALSYKGYKFWDSYSEEIRNNL